MLFSNHNSFRVLFDKIASVYFVWKIFLYILALETASPGNRHCANCIGTHAFPMHGRRLVESVMYGGPQVPTSKKTHNTTVLSCCVVGFLDVGPVLGHRIVWVVLWVRPLHNSFIWLCCLKSHNTTTYKKLSYRRGTARCVVSIEILPIATQQCRNYLYDESWPNRWYEVGDLVGGNAW